MPCILLASKLTQLLKGITLHPGSESGKPVGHQSIYETRACLWALPSFPQCVKSTHFQTIPPHPSHVSSSPLFFLPHTAHRHTSLLSLEQENASDQIGRSLNQNIPKTGKKDQQGGVLVVKDETHTTVRAHSSAWRNCPSTNQQGSIINLVNSSRKTIC